MKKFFVSLVMLLSLSAASLFAQSSLIATLSHEGEVKMFYGALALQQAHNAATHGDVITLSSGTFLSTTITKAITLRGAGFKSDVDNGVFSTNISGISYINIQEDSDFKLTIEGLYLGQYLYVKSDLTNATFAKCRFYSIYFQGNGTNAQFVHCKINNISYSGGGAGNNIFSFINSYVRYPYFRHSSVTSEFQNCIVDYYHTDAGSFSSNPKDIGAAKLSNCIIVGAPDESADYNRYKEGFSSSVSAYKCMALNFTFNIWQNVSSPNVYATTGIAKVFKTLNGDCSETETFELTDEAKAKYLGLDGTEIGIYGGSLPFDPKTSAPQITKFNVASKSTVDGKLSVDIEVKGVE